MITQSTILQRVARLRTLMLDAELPALLISQPEARRYLSGYTPRDLPPRESAGVLLITEERQVLLTDPRTEELARKEAADFEVRLYGGQVRMSDALKQLCGELRVRKLGFDAGHVTYTSWLAFGEALEGVADLVAAPTLVDRLRVLKDETEVGALRASIELNDRAFAHLARTVRPGIAESELAWELEAFMRTHGAEELSFEPITVAGPNTAIPHAIPTDRRVAPGDAVLFDIGGRVSGYCSDMTRTFFLDFSPSRLGDVWQIVLEAQQEALARLRPGMTGAEVDAVARGVIERAGYGEQFLHGLGHGIGLEIHEPPWLTQSRGTDVLQPGMVFSLEPGIYLSGEGGVRLEDLVLLTEEGPEVLSHAPKKLSLAEALRDLDR